MMKEQLVIDLAGTVDGQVLTTVRERLGLKKGGRLTDDWDANFGHRDLGAEPNRIWLDLYREDDTNWTVALAYQAEPVPADEQERLRRQVLELAAEVGLEVTGQFPALANARDEAERT